MRRTNTLAATALLALLLSACAGAPAASTAPTAAPATAAPATGAPATSGPAASVDAGRLSGAALLLTQKRGDKGVVDALYDGFQKATADLGYQQKQVVELTDPATYEQTIRQVADSGVSIIVATFPPMIDSIKAVAPDYPDINFVIIDASLGESFPNVQELYFFENESSYLAGIAAGMMTEANKVGFIGGDDVDVINRYLVGYYEGAHAANPDVTVCWSYAKSFEDPAKGKELALAMINDQGVDVLHAATAGTQLGIYEATESTETPLISADVDVIPLAPKSGLFSTGPRFDQAVVLPLEQNATNSFKTGFQQYGLSTDLVGHTPFSSLVPADVQAAVEKAKEDVASGAIKVGDDKKLASYSNCQ